MRILRFLITVRQRLDKIIACDCYAMLHLPSAVLNGFVLVFLLSFCSVRV